MPKSRPHRFGDNAAAAHDETLREKAGHIGQRAVHGQRHGSEARAGKQHYGVLGWDTAGIGDKLGLPGKVEADLGERGLGDRAGDDAGCRAANGKTRRPPARN